MDNKSTKYIKKSIKGRSIISNIEIDESYLVSCNENFNKNNLYDIGSTTNSLRTLYTNNISVENLNANALTASSAIITTGFIDIAEITQANIQSSSITTGNIDNLTCGTLQINSTDGNFRIGNKRYIDKIAEFIDVDNHYTDPINYYKVIYITISLTL